MIFKAVSLISSVALLGLAACAPIDKPSDDLAIIDPAGPVQCASADWQSYVGKPRSELPQAPAGLVFRQACKTCAVTMDYRPDRVTFAYDEDGIIIRASCG